MLRFWVFLSERLHPIAIDIITMDVLASEIDTEPPCVILFVDDLVLCETSKEAVERDGGSGGRALEK